VCNSIVSTLAVFLSCCQQLIFLEVTFAIVKTHHHVTESITSLCVYVQIERARGGGPAPFTSAATDTRIAAN